MRKTNFATEIIMAASLSVVLAFWISDLNLFSTKITVYSVYCGKDTGDQGACINLPSITYQASPDRQVVYYWTDTGVPTTLTDCSVHDRQNWECWYKDRAGRLSMVDGAFREEVQNTALNQDVFDSVRYVPKWKWWAVKIGINTDG